MQSAKDSFPEGPAGASGAGLKAFLDSGRYADVRLKLDSGREFAVHRVVLAAHSRVLDKLVATARPHGSPVDVNLGAPSLDEAFPELLTLLYGGGVDLHESNLVPMYLLSLDLDVPPLTQAALDAARALLAEHPPRAALLLRQAVRTRPPHSAALALRREDPLIAACLAVIVERGGGDGKRLRRALQGIACETDLCEFLETLRGIEEAIGRTPPARGAEGARRRAMATEARQRDPKRQRVDGRVFALDEDTADEASERGTDAESAGEEDGRLLDAFAAHMKIGSRAIAIPRRTRPADFDFVI